MPVIIRAGSYHHSDERSPAEPFVPTTCDMPKWWSISDLWGRLTQKKAMKPEVREMLTSLDGVYEQQPVTVSQSSAAPPQRNENN